MRDITSNFGTDEIAGIYTLDAVNGAPSWHFDAVAGDSMDWELHREAVYPGLWTATRKRWTPSPGDRAANWWSAGTAA